jgi:hypothetical protein
VPVRSPTPAKARVSVWTAIPSRRDAANVESVPIARRRFAISAVLRGFAKCRLAMPHGASWLAYVDDDNQGRTPRNYRRAVLRATSRKLFLIAA